MSLTACVFVCFRFAGNRIRNGNQVAIFRILIGGYPGRILDTNDFRTIITMQAEIWSSYALETNTRTTAYERTFNIEQCLREAMAGVALNGVGTVSFARMDSSYNGSELLYINDGVMLGRIVYYSIAWSEGGGGTIH